jgi:hypothetical protein
MQQVLGMLAEMNAKMDAKREKWKAEMKAWQAESDAYNVKLNAERKKKKEGNNPYLKWDSSP